jgi:hypothetical protein
LGREFAFHISARGPGIVIVAKDPRDLTNGCPESHPQIVKQQNLVLATNVGALIVFCALARGQGGVKFIVRISENYNLWHANLNTTIKVYDFIV